VLHSKNITITDKASFQLDLIVTFLKIKLIFQTLEESNGQLMNITEMLEFIPGQQLYIESLQPFLKNHNYTLKLRFIYRLSTELEGFYVSSYTTPEGEKRYPFPTKKFMSCGIVVLMLHKRLTLLRIIKKFISESSPQPISKRRTPGQRFHVLTSRTSRLASKCPSSETAFTFR
jgi:hypothetical protein